MPWQLDSFLPIVKARQKTICHAGGSAAFLPLGLPISDPFWSGPPTLWTSKRIWTGEQVGLDHALAEHPESVGDAEAAK
jgi:hypothetical protein